MRTIWQVVKKKSMQMAIREMAPSFKTINLKRRELKMLILAPISKINRVRMKTKNFHQEPKTLLLPTKKGTS